MDIKCSVDDDSHDERMKGGPLWPLLLFICGSNEFIGRRATHHIETMIVKHNKTRTGGGKGERGTQVGGKVTSVTLKLPGIEHINPHFGHTQEIDTDQRHLLEWL